MTDTLPATTVATRGPYKRYDLEDIELGLHALALNACKYDQTAQLLNEQGVLAGITKQTLWNWANATHKDRFEEIRTEISSQVADRVANQAEEIALLAGEAIIDLIHDLNTKRHDMKAADLAGAARNLATVQALSIDKLSSPIRGRPNVRIHDRTAEEIFRALAQLEPGLIVNGTATEIQPGEDPPQAAIA